MCIRDRLSSTDAWAVGHDDSKNKPLIKRWNGRSWTNEAEASGTDDCALTAVSAIASNDVWAVGSCGVSSTSKHPHAQHWDGIRWTTVAVPITGGGGLLGVAAIGRTDVTAVGTKLTSGSPAPLVVRWNGTAWSEVNVPQPPGQGVLTGITERNSSYWAAGYYSPQKGQVHPLVLKGLAVEWRIETVPDAGSAGTWLSGIHAVSNSDIWAVGSNIRSAVIVHSDGTKWTVVPSPRAGTSEASLNALSGTVANDQWAVGQIDSSEKTLIEHWDGHKWTVVASPDTSVNGANALNGVAVISTTEAWAVGAIAVSGGSAIIERWDGKKWSMVSAALEQAVKKSRSSVVTSRHSDSNCVGNLVGKSGELPGLGELFCAANQKK